MKVYPLKEYNKVYKTKTDKNTEKLTKYYICLSAAKDLKAQEFS